MTGFYRGRRVKRSLHGPSHEICSYCNSNFFARDSGVIPIIFDMKNRVVSFTKGVISPRVGRSW